MSKKYRITLTEEQMRVTEKILEMSIRLLMGQDWMFSDEVTMLNADMSPDNPNHNRIFDAYIKRRDHVRDVMKAVYSIAFEPTGYLGEKSEDMLEAETIWDAIRTVRGHNRWGKAYQSGKEPIPDIEEVEA